MSRKAGSAKAAEAEVGQRPMPPRTTQAQPAFPLNPPGESEICRRSGGRTRPACRLRLPAEAFRNWSFYIIRCPRLKFRRNEPIIPFGPSSPHRPPEPSPTTCPPGPPGNASSPPWRRSRFCFSALPPSASADSTKPTPSTRPTSASCPPRRHHHPRPRTRPNPLARIPRPHPDLTTSCSALESALSDLRT